MTTSNSPNSSLFTQHLIELRMRLLKCFGVIIGIFCALIYFANDIYAFISTPLKRYLPENAGMIATDITSPFFTPFKLTLVVSIFIAIPFLLHQIWSFMSPGLYKAEKKIAMSLLCSSIILFYAGVVFAFYIVFPILFGFFTSIVPNDVTMMTDINNYLDFVLKMFFAFGIAFEIPIFTIVCVWTGITDIQSLKQKRPYIIIICFILGMLLTPPDVFSQSLLAIPTWLLFESGIFFSRFIAHKSAT